MKTMIGSKEIDLDNLPSVCAWRHCDKITPPQIEEGWHNLLMYEGELAGSIEEAVMTARRDCVLCPEHSKLFDSMLKGRNQDPDSDLH